jgi:hypothetical protein
MLSHIKDGQGHWTVTLNGQPHLFDPSHPHYASLIKCVHAGDADEFVNLLNTGLQVENWSEGDFEFRDGLLYFEDEQVAKDPTNRIVECLQQGFPHQFMMNYLTNLYDNVSERAVQESYKWSSHKGLPITEDGMLVGYKGVRTYAGETIQGKNGEIKEGDLVDIYTGNSFRNNVGDTASMKRRQVCDDHTQGCDTGLHVGTYDYACDWAGNTGVVVLVKFNPKDIVSVPSDCECQKMRVSSYEVISIAREQLEEAVYSDDYDDEYEDDYYEEADF